MRMITVIDRCVVIENTLRNLHIRNGTPPLAPARAPLDAPLPHQRKTMEDVIDIRAHRQNLACNEPDASDSTLNTLGQHP